MKIIADTNIFIAVALNEPEKKIIINLTEGHDLVAPEVLPFEIGNALTAMVKRKTLLTDEAVLAWDAIQNIPVDLRRINIVAALKISMQHNTYAYDAYFLECALNQRSPLLTLDRQMKEIATKIGIQIME
jgi:predicted nucleic acid-binding protein